VSEKGAFTEGFKREREREFKRERVQERDQTSSRLRTSDIWRRREKSARAGF